VTTPADRLRPYPWQAEAWAALSARLQEGRLPHALLFTGPAGVGKRHLGGLFTQALLCEARREDGTPCGACRGCLLFAAGSHPDHLLMVPEEEGKGLTVDQARGVAAFQVLTPKYGSRKAVLVAPADRLNVNAANALLKTLEEPTAGTVIVLVTDRPTALLPTIRSRCQRVELPAVPPAQALPWLTERLAEGLDAATLLAQAAGAPLLALSHAGGEEVAARAAAFDAFEAVAAGRSVPVTVAEGWHGLGAERVLAWVYGWLADMARLRAGAAAAQLTNPGLAARLQPLAERVDLATLHRQLERTTQALRLARGQVNGQMLLEEIVITWARCARGAMR
jgi:DNA polymerase-3 subunit delta'